MTEKLHESLSALMDNEADELELRRILKEMENGENSENSESMENRESGELDELQARWHRYHVVSASLKQEIHVNPSCNLLSGIRAALENDEIPTGKPAFLKSTPDSRNRSPNRFLQTIGQGAIAASMALAVLFTADMVLEGDINDVGEQGNAEIADNSAGQLPDMTGDLNPATPTRIAVQPKLNEAEIDRLERVVSETLEDSLESREVDATFTPPETP